MEYLKAFLVGGIICAIVQIFMEKTKLMPGRIMVGMVCIGSLISALGWYEGFAKWAGAGAKTPLLGFGNMLYTGVKDEIDKEGLIGIFTGGLSATAAGITAALVLGYIASLLFKPKMKG